MRRLTARPWAIWGVKYHLGVTTQGWGKVSCNGGENRINVSIWATLHLPSPNPITTLGRGRCAVVQILRLIWKMPQKKGHAERGEYTNWWNYGKQFFSETCRFLSYMKSVSNIEWSGWKEDQTWTETSAVKFLLLGSTNSTGWSSNSILPRMVPWKPAKITSDMK